MSKIDHKQSMNLTFDLSLSDQMLNICKGLVNRHCDAFGPAAAIEFRRGITVHAGVDDDDMLTVGVGFCEGGRLPYVDFPVTWLGKEHEFIPDYIAARLDVAQARRNKVASQLRYQRNRYVAMLESLGRATWAVEHIPIEFTLIATDRITIEHPDPRFVDHLRQNVSVPLGIDCMTVGFSDQIHYMSSDWFQRRGA